MQMQKTIAILCSLDTKEQEALYVKHCIERAGMRTFLIDVSTRNYVCALNPDVTSHNVFAASGVDPKQASSLSKLEWISAQQAGAAKLVPELCGQGAFDGILSIGGLQNTIIGAEALKRLPFGLPKVMLSTVASGIRKMDMFMGSRDVTAMHSVADIVGINPITETVLKNAANAVIGMVAGGGQALTKPSVALTGCTVLGVASPGAPEAIRLLEENGHKVAAFHSSGIGGRCMDELIESGVLSSAMEFSLHEIICNDVMKKGYAMGAKNRLCAAVKRGIPLLVTPGGLDFNDYSAEQFNAGMAGDISSLKYLFHNSEVVHVKLSPEDGIRAAKLVSERLNESAGPVSVLLPLKGFRSDVQPGQALYCPEVDNAMINTFRQTLKPSINRIEVMATINDAEFSLAAATEMQKILKLPEDNAYET